MAIINRNSDAYLDASLGFNRSTMYHEEYHGFNISLKMKSKHIVYTIEELQIRIVMSYEQISISTSQTQLLTYDEVINVNNVYNSLYVQTLVDDVDSDTVYKITPQNINIIKATAVYCYHIPASSMYHKIESKDIDG